MRFLPRSVVALAAVMLALVTAFAGGPVRAAVATPTPEVPAEVAIYAVQLAGQIDVLADALDEAAVLLAEPQPGNLDWQIDVAMQFVAIQGVYEALQKIEPPTAMAAVHEQTLDAVQDCNDSTVLATSGLDNLNVADLQAAAELMTSCTNKIGVAQEMVIKYMVSLSAPAAATPTLASTAITGTAMTGTAMTGTAMTGTATRDANVRAGPGTAYAVVGSLTAGDKVQIVGTNSAGDWYKLDSGKWVAAFLVKVDAASMAVTMRTVTATPVRSTPQGTVSMPTTTPVPKVTPVPTATALAFSGPVASSEANVREGPGTEYAVVTAAQSGESLEIVGKDSSGKWLQLASGYWIAASLVDGAPADLPVTAVVAQLPGGNPTAAPMPAQESAAAPTPSWQREEGGILFSSECPCNQGDALNCGDFGIDMDAQACYMRCMDLAGMDVHRLDRDKDGSACEWNW